MQIGFTKKRVISFSHHIDDGCAELVRLSDERHEGDTIFGPASKATKQESACLIIAAQY
jgi:hypothetical protein|eukprot:COSAG06_NODE_2377_length_6984_cov_28.325635_1_plen_59_part_00